MFWAQISSHTDLLLDMKEIFGPDGFTEVYLGVAGVFVLLNRNLSVSFIA